MTRGKQTTTTTTRHRQSATLGEQLLAERRQLVNKSVEDAAHKRRRRKGSHLFIYHPNLLMPIVALFLAILHTAQVTEGGDSQRPQQVSPAHTADYFTYYFPLAPPSRLQASESAIMSHNSQGQAAGRRRHHHHDPPSAQQRSQHHHQQQSSQQRTSTSPGEPGGRPQRRTPPEATSAPNRRQPELEFRSAASPRQAPQQQQQQHGNQWIPIVASSPQHHHHQGQPSVREQPKPARLQVAATSDSDSGSRAALLDYPPVQAAQPRPPGRQQPHTRVGAPANHRRPPSAAQPRQPNANRHGRAQQARNATRAATGGSRPRQGRGREIQLAQASHSYPHTDNHAHHHHYQSPPVHSSNNYHNHHHHHHHHHLHWPPPAQRTPRFQHAAGELGPPPQDTNELGGASSASKMYKRVLLCDKTLVSLDYIRQPDIAEPRPFKVAAPGGSRPHYELLPHEHFDWPASDEIADNFLDLEGNFDSSVPLARDSRPSDSSGSPPVNSTTTQQVVATRRHSSAQHSNSSTTTTTTAIDKSLAMQANETAPEEITIELEGEAEGEPAERRRLAAFRESLLSDHDPLVRCDMWDLEKGLKSRKPPGHILRMAVRADFDTVRDAINRCRQLSERTLPPEDEYRGVGVAAGAGGADGAPPTIELMSTEDLVSLFSMKRGLMPGTKWCGLGDQAETYNDLGPKHRIDICCRAHDHCPIRSKPFRNDYGVLNIGLYTKSHCDCDADFYRCLREVRSRTADMLGNLYFNVMKLQCMREERLKVCREMKPLALGFERCVRYEDSPRKTVFKFTTPPVAY